MKKQNTFRQSAIAAAVTALITLTSQSVVAQTNPVSDKITSLIAQMTLDEKISFLHGTVQGFDMANQHDPENKAAVGFIPGVKRLGIPALRLTDGPAGARHPMHLATAMPSPVALAASFDPALAEQYGNVIGVEARALDQDILLSPMVNIVRTPQAGRNFETLGEDPLLAGKLVASEIKGIQDKGLMATVKHFAANNQETDRGTGVSVVDERTLQEIYLPAFEQAVKADVASFMCSYNRLAIDGKGNDYSCANEMLLTDILRGQWGYKGFVMTDWYATLFEGKAPDPTPIKAGLDMEMPSGFFFGEPLKQAVTKGDIPVSDIDQAVGRILTQMERFHMLDGKLPARAKMDDVAAEHAAIALKTAREGAVLLKNRQSVLPLSAEDLNDLLIIGSTAQVPVIGGGGSSHVKAKKSISPLQALNDVAGKAQTAILGIDLDGTAIPMSALKTADGQSGLTRKLKNSTITVANIDLAGEKNALPAYSKVTWQGMLTAPETGEYDIKLHIRGGAATLKLGNGDAKGEPQLNSNGFFATTNRLLPSREGMDIASFRILLKKGEQLPLTVTGSAGEANMLSNGITSPDDPLEIRMAWVTPSQRKAELQKAVAAAKQHKGKVLVFAFNEGTEGQDRPSLALPDGQDELLSAITKANQNTVVVLNTGDPVTMPWAQKAAAVLQMWYSGQEGAMATADILTGKVNPSGKLPVTFPVTEKDTPLQTAEQFPGVKGRVNYSEGLLVGYRWYDTKAIKPLFAFGHGLSYTRFKYSAPEVKPITDGYQVSFTVSNTGDRDGTDVSQVYLGAAADAPIPMAAKSLAGFEKVTLAKGESKTVSLQLDKRAFSYWDVTTHGWKVLQGKRTVLICDSSACDNNKLQTEIELNL
ncbi:beta-glucosidase family protein [Tolumonas osonensis]|uniref:Beta-glucosidase n=1 Tax=Tolumonas osonensis TaxID=675874 RepID=A0A841G981_9GAMM|nr:glycoside hydrolase family 3 C-terminal domain-containing protein [Tolumonas osonensis]MBB6055694.1 beta-glucosidase [Tolumonas osonensis]